MKTTAEMIRLLKKDLSKMRFDKSFMARSMRREIKNDIRRLSKSK